MDAKKGCYNFCPVSMPDVQLGNRAPSWGKHSRHTSLCSCRTEFWGASKSRGYVSVSTMYKIKANVIDTRYRFYRVSFPLWLHPTLTHSRCWKMRITTFPWPHSGSVHSSTRSAEKKIETIHLPILCLIGFW